MVSIVNSRCGQHFDRLQHVAILDVDLCSFGNPVQHFQQLDTRFFQLIILQEL